MVFSHINIQAECMKAFTLIWCYCYQLYLTIFGSVSVCASDIKQNMKAYPQTTSIMLLH